MAITLQDQIGHQIILSAPAVRIVSLVPSQTELLYALGLDYEVIGITKFCVHPEKWFRTKKRIGGTKQINIESILSLQPDLVIANKEENVKEQIEALRLHIPVYTSCISKLEEAVDMIKDIATLTGKSEKGVNLAEEIVNRFKTLSFQKTYRTLYLIWRDPYMAAGDDTFIHTMMQRAGMENVLNDKNRYPALSSQDIKELNPELVLLSSEPYPFKEKHIEELSQILPDTKILLVNGEMFSWYGSRLKDAPDYFYEVRNKLFLSND